MTRILDTPTLRTPAMMYLFHRVEERLDGTPAIIVIDEGWKALDDDIFVHKINASNPGVSLAYDPLGRLYQTA